jgi:hypothetical protein
MAKDSCLNCGKLLPANKELASVPNARLVAFDPDANRVWRICDPCGHWNLLGPEAARAATPELLARYEASAAAGRPGLAMAVISGKLLLLRVGAAPNSAGAAMLAQEVHAELGKGLTWRQGAAVLVILGLCAGAFLLLEQVPLVSALLDSDARRIALPTWLGTHYWLSSKELLRGRHRWARWAPVLFVPTIVLDSWGGDSPFWVRVAALAVGVGVGVWTGRIDGAPRGISWDDGDDNPRYHDGHHPDAPGWTGLSLLLFELDREFSGKVTAEERAAAWDLWQRNGSLRTMLGGFSNRRSASGRLMLTDLTKPERMALLIAVGARLAEPPAEVIAGLEEAERVAAIAEALDNELTPPTPPAPLPPAPPA